MRSPLLGYNTNVRHLGRLYHIQTEDSGSAKAHIFTHLFADGGRIIASKKTTYDQYVGTDHYPEVVKLLMRESHKAMFIALRDGLFDDDEAAGAKALAEIVIRLPDEAPADLDALDKAAAERLATAAAQQTPRSPSRRPPPAGRYQPTRPVKAPTAPPAPPPRTESIFGGDLLSEKSLDEVILSYLADDEEA